MIIIALFSAIISMFSPFWGLIFTLSYGNKYQDKRNSFYLTFAAGSVVLLIAKIISILSFFDILIGVGLTSMLYFFVLHQTFDYLKAILASFILNVFYAVIRHFAFGKSYIQTFQQVLAEYKEIFISSFQDNPDQLDFAIDLIEKVGDLFSKYYLGIWVAMGVIAVYIGSQIISRKVESHWKHKTCRLPFSIIYALIGSLVLLLIPNTTIIGKNILIMLVPLFLIQGSSILDFFWGEYFRKSKFLLILLIFSIVLNYYILLLITLIGMVDVWFNIRKLDSMEE